MKFAQKNHATQLFEEYCGAYRKRDLQAILNMFTEDCNLWGTGIDEYRVGLKELEIQHQRDWSQSSQGAIRIVSWVPTPNDALLAAAVCKALITMEGKEHIFDDLRGTIIIRKEKGIWKIAHMHASFPDFRNALGGSFPLHK